MKTHRREFTWILGVGPVAGWAARFFGKDGIRPNYIPAMPLPSASGPTPGKWYEQLTAGVHLDYHYPEWDEYILSKANPRDDIRKMVDTGCKVVVVFAKCMYGHAYYNTKVGHKHKNLGDRDFLAEWIEEARKHKLVVLAYHIMHEDLWAGVHHPEWTMKEPDGKIVPGRLGNDYMCYNSGYRDYVKAMVREIMQYDIDGFHFDMLWFGRTGTVCYCPENCASLFRKKYGIDIPPKPSWDDTWRKFLEFRYETNATFCEEITQLVKTHRPELSVMYNYHAQPPNSWPEAMKPVRHRMISDYGTGEGYPPRHGHSYASLFSCFLSGTAPGSPWQGVTSRYTRGINDHTTRPVADMRWETFTFLSHGGMPLFVDTPEDDGSLDPVAYKRMKTIFEEVRQKRDYFGFEPVQEVGLYFSLKTRDWYGKEDPKRYLGAYMGAHKAFIESHIPVGTIFDETVTLERLKQFPLVYLANTAILEAKETELLREYVRQGGNLVATADSSLFDLDGRPMKDFGLADVFGAGYQGKTEFNDNYFSLPDGFLSEGTESEGNNFLEGPNNLLNLAGGLGHGQLKVAFHDRGPNTRIGHAVHNAAWKAVGPAVVIHEFGKGKVAYLPFAPEAAYVDDFGLPEHRLIIRNVVRHLLPSPAVQVEAPLNVESVVTKDTKNSRYVIHFISCVSVRDAVSPVDRPLLVPRIEEGWIYKARISFHSPIRRARALNASSLVAVKGTAVEFQTSDIHEAVVVDY